MMNASSIACSRPKSWPMILIAGLAMPAGAPRKASKRAKIAAALEALVKVAPEKPAKATASMTPGVSWMILEARCTTASVRASEAPSGS